ncbi:DNA translocase FtsK [Halalkalibacterium ligniniphilum]|uniref:DNA translocase FtsK n=1 Tax=Halalkalibacterium ligniniphilum TaxID=1134413 RepID=UPI000347B0CE|nr:DNA translocase FtsK [Halalkalibacterium ligniniphilum]
MGTFLRWLERIQQLFLGREEEEPMTRSSRSQSISKRSRQYGRLHTEERKVESKVIHQYPKPGKFRFPLIEDEAPPIARQSKSKKRREESPEAERETKPVAITEKSDTTEGREEVKKERFNNPHFKPSSIPSPIYGFKDGKGGPRRTIDLLTTKPSDLSLLNPSSIADQELLGNVVPFRVEERKRMERKIPRKLDERKTREEESLIRDKHTGERLEKGKTVTETSRDGHRREEGQENDVDINMEHVAEESYSLKTELELPTQDVSEGVEVEEESAQATAEELQEPSAYEMEEVWQKEGLQSIIEQESLAADVNENDSTEEESTQANEWDNQEQVEVAAYNDEQSPPVIKRSETFENEGGQADQDFEWEKNGVSTPESCEKEAESQAIAQIDEQADDAIMVSSGNRMGAEDRNEQIDHAEGATESEQVAATIDNVGMEQAEQTTTGEEKTRSNVVKEKEVEEKTPERKTSIPFNVLMLPQDRASQKRVTHQTKNEEKNYQFPSIQLLHYPEKAEEDDSEWLDEQALLLEETLQSFNVDAKVVNVTKGPSVTRFEIQPARGVKVNKITGLTDDIKLSLAAKDIRIEAPIPGKNTIGIEVPNRVSSPVMLREILRRDVFLKPRSPLTVALGLDISGQPVVTDLNKMPHGLVAGATGSGKSVCINSILISLLYKARPEEVKLMLIDPKMVELAPYNDLPHLVTPVITDAKQATAALKWVVGEMERRYELFSQNGVRDLARYNDLYSESVEKPALPYILVVIDELADLMMVSPQEVEDSICRIAQKARACGIHLLLATQRPSVDVITGLIKANIPTRIAFSVSSQTDSRTILDMNGAERLLGQGDMLFHANGSAKPIRVQGTFVSDEEIEHIIAHVKKQQPPNYLLENEQLVRAQEHFDQEDELFDEACLHVIEQGSASASSLQRRFRVGYNRAARLIDMMEAQGVVSEAMGSKPRHVLIDEIEFQERFLLGHED